MSFSMFLGFLFVVPEKRTPVTRGACLINRGLVRFAMKSFSGAVEDLGGAGASGGHGRSNVGPPPSVIGGPPLINGKEGNDAAVAAACGSVGGRLALDCSLARALAEGRLECKTSRKVRLEQGRSMRQYWGYCGPISDRSLRDKLALTCLVHPGPCFNHAGKLRQEATMTLEHVYGRPHARALFRSSFTLGLNPFRSPQTSPHTNSK